MDIVHIASEFAPIAKVGGLGDAVSGLAKACAKLGHNVTVILPKYDTIKEPLSSLEEDIKLILIDSEHREFDRGQIYGEEDDILRFLTFNKLASAYLEKRSFDVIHLHDWHAAGCTLFLKNSPRTIFTIHNLMYQGECLQGELTKMGVKTNTTNLMELAILNCDAFTTVSPTYAKEILTPEYGCGLEKTLIENREKLTGILNGIDTDTWNPETDSHLQENYTKETWTTGKRANKEAAQKHFHLPIDSTCPLVTAITRLVPQKGPDLILYGIEKTLELGGQFVLLGSCADEEMRASFEAFEDNRSVALYFEFNEPLSHLLYGASDMFLMPSIFEPCGLSQMIALQYGSVPLVRKTGGLKDTIEDGVNGFTFDTPDNASITSLMERAFKAYKAKQWNSFIETGMSTNLSWETSAQKYLKLYQT